MPGLCHGALPGLCQRGLGRAVDGSGLRRQGSRRATSSQFCWGGASPQIEVCHTELCQVFARELCQVFARRFSSLTPMRAWVLNYVRRELWSGQVRLAPTLYVWCLPFVFVSSLSSLSLSVGRSDLLVRRRTRVTHRPQDLTLRRPRDLGVS